MSKDGTQAKGWHDDFASDRPEHVRRQGKSRLVVKEGKIVAENSFASPTGLDMRQADMVSKQAVRDLAERLGNSVFIDRRARMDFIEELEEL